MLINNLDFYIYTNRAQFISYELKMEVKFLKRVLLVCRTIDQLCDIIAYILIQDMRHVITQNIDTCSIAKCIVGKGAEAGRKSEW